MRELLIDVVELWEQNRQYYGNDFEVFVNDFTNNRIDCYDEINDIFKENISDWSKWHEQCKKQVIETTIKILKK